MVKHGFFIRLSVVIGLITTAFVAGRFTASKPMAEVALASSRPPAEKSVRAEKQDEGVRDRLGESQIKETLLKLGDNPSSEKNRDDYVQALVAWAAIDPDAALAYAATHIKSFERRSQVIARILSALARKEPQAAWAWTLKNSPDNLQYIDAVLNEIGQNNPDTAWAYAQEYAKKYPAEVYTAYVGVLRGMGYAGNYEAAAGLIEQINQTNPNDGFNLPNLLVSQWGRYEPEKAMAWAQSLPPSSARDSTLVQAGSAWAVVDPEAAANFAVQLTEGAQRGSVLTQVIGSWVSSDPLAAAKWVSRLETGPDTNQVVAQIATLPSITDHSLAIEWTDAITDQELRLQSLTRIYQMWMVGNPEAAEADLLNNKQVSLEIRSQVIDRLGLHK